MSDPVLRVVRGCPSDDELGALVAVVAARGSAADEPEPHVRPLWGRPVLRSTAALGLVPGPGGWRCSALPR